MEILQQPSIFAQLIDKLRNKSEAELTLLYTQLFANDLAQEWESNIVAESFVSYEADKSETEIDTVLKKKNSLDKVFGIWESENITLNSIREQAWQRTK